MNLNWSLLHVADECDACIAIAAQIFNWTDLTDSEQFWQEFFFDFYSS